MTDFEKLFEHMVDEVQIPLIELEKIDTAGDLRRLKLKYLDLKFRTKENLAELMTPVTIAGLNKSKRSLWSKFLIWSGVRKFDEISIEQLRRLSPNAQRKYLQKKYAFYGLNPTV